MEGIREIAEVDLSGYRMRNQLVILYRGEDDWLVWAEEKNGKKSVLPRHFETLEQATSYWKDLAERIANPFEEKVG
jgi:hypothetical protein